MIIEAYPNALDVSLLAQHVIGSVIMTGLMGMIAFATFQRIAAMLTHQAPAGALEILAEIGTFCFACLIGALCVTRLKPTRQASGMIPMISALGGSFVLTVVNFVPLADLSPAAKTLAVFLLATGNFLSVYCLAYLGRSFSILPQARKLVTEGPYGIVRHPLYIAEAVAASGLILLHLSPLSIVTGLLLFGLQLRRVLFEESVLGAAFPDYAEYARTVPRFIPRFR